MTTAARAIPRGAPAGAANAAEPGSRFAPKEGWTAFVLVVLMLLLLAWSIDAAEYRGGDLYWLTWVVIVGATWGLVGARLPVARWEAHGLGALLGGGLVVVLVAGEVSNDPDLGARLHALGLAAAQWYRDVTGPSGLSTQNVAWLATCGIFSWATAHFVSYAVFGHRRPLVAIAVPGVLLVVNMVIAASVDLLFLVLFSVAGLLLLVRMNLVEQRDAWARSRIGEAAGAGELAARSGALIVVATVVLSLVLASIGSSAPLAALWDTFQGRAQDAALRVNDLFNLSPAVRFPGDPFETSQVITGEWEASSRPTLRVSTSDNGSYYFRGTVYDRFVDGNRWLQSGPTSTGVDAGESLLEALAGDGDLDPEAMTAVTFRVTVLRDLRVVLSPAVPQVVSIPVRLDRLGDGGPFAAVRPPAGTLPEGSTYDVTALVPRLGAGGLTKNALRAAGTRYPPEIIARYAVAANDVDAYDADPAGHSSVPELATEIIAKGNLSNPFDIADAFQWYLSDPANFTYRANVRGLCEPGESVPDCFVRIRQGYCEYYATTMIMMLRSQGIPARLAVGYLPPDNAGMVLSSSAHAWVEVFFPGYGWVSFDPTGGNGAGPIRFPEGAAAAGPTAPPVDTERNDAIQQGRGQSAPGGTDASREIGASLLPIALAAIAALAVAFIVWRRWPRRQPDVVTVYGRVTRIASWLGFPPLPSQTVFEYTGALAEVLPETRPELQAVARAKVEATYRPVPLPRERLEAVAAAYRRLRLGLARLIYRRGRRSGEGHARTSR